jgi:hypothetical protein
MTADIFDFETVKRKRRFETDIDPEEFNGLVKQFLPIVRAYVEARVEMHGPSRVINYTVLNALAAVVALTLCGAEYEDFEWFVGAVEDAWETNEN